MSLMNIPAFRNQQQTLIRKSLSDIYTHERAHKTAGGLLAGPIVIEWQNGIPVGGHVSISMPRLNPKNPQKTIDNAEIVINSALAPSDPSAQDYKVANQAKSVKAQAQRLQNNKKVDYYA